MTGISNKKEGYQSEAVIRTPAQRGKKPRVRIWMAMALPMTS